MKVFLHLQLHLQSATSGNNKILPSSLSLENHISFFWVKPVVFHKWIDEDDFGDSDQLVWNKLLLSLTTQLCNLKLYTVLPFYLLVLKWILTKVLKIDCIR